jgi:hypothetical protein
VVSALVLVIAQVSGSSGVARPAECTTLESGATTNVWERAKAPELRHYCDLLASGAAKVVSGAQVAEVLAIADEADRAMPGRAAPSVLRGRALSRLGRDAEALAALRGAKTKDERALDEPVALLVFARTLARTGHSPEALDAYRALLPRASSLVLVDRGAAYVEAGMLAMSNGTKGLDEATAMLRQARRDSQDTVQALCVYALALALDRAGETGEARATLTDRPHGEAHTVFAEPRAHDTLGPSGSADLDAMAGLAMELSDPDAARAAWQRFLAGPGGKGPWAEHARGHLAGLGGKSKLAKQR